MTAFVGLVHHDEGSAYGVTFPDVPGCFAAADDFEGVVAAGADALSLWFEDQPLVRARPIEAIKAEVAAELREGAVLVLVHHIVRKGLVKRANVSLDAGELEAIDAEAKRRKMTRSAFITEAARNEIEYRRAG